MTEVIKPNILKKFKDLENFFGLKNEIKWGTSLIIFLFHAFAVYWCYYYATPVKGQTILFAYFIYACNAIGIGAGVHRYWSHHAFKATRPMEVMLFIMYAAAGLTTVRRFVRNHRLHHKCSDTDADPHSADRGLFFSHIGWLMMKKTNDAIRHGKTIDLSDIDSDPMLMWHERNMVLVNTTLCFVLPTLANIWLFGETWQCAVAWQCFIRYLVVFHAALSTNSLAHKYGHRPYNRNIKPVENMFVVIATIGEGFHNYHHSFPFDYKGTDQFLRFNIATMTIKLCEKIGWAYDLKEATPEMVSSISQRLGDKFQMNEELKSY